MSIRVHGMVLWVSFLMCACAPSSTNVDRPKPAVTASATPEASVRGPSLTRTAVIAARKKYRVEVVSFDASQEYGSEFPYSDMVRVRVTNGSNITLPALTLLTKRFDGSGKMIGSSRAPSIPVRDLMPGETAEVDFYPRGHLPGVKRITVEIEALIAPDDEEFFDELKGVAAG